MTKQFLLFWIIASILLLAACSSSSSNIPATGTSIAGQASLTPETPLPPSRTPTRPPHTPTLQETLDLTDEDLRGTVIHFWHAWNGESGKVIRQLVDEFNLNNRWGIVVVPVMHSSYDELNAKLDISLAQRNPPDLVAAFLHQALSWNLDGGLVELDAMSTILPGA
jgi:ABC-type glycerol-3-phosphate transport system substrate-binding protein